MVDYWKQQLVPGNAALVVVGAVSRKELEAMTTKAFAGWAGKAAARTKLPAPRGTSREAGDRRQAGRGPIRAARRAPSRSRASTPDWYPLQVANYVLGGNFTSRINLNLREDKGYTYGARSGFEGGRAAGRVRGQRGGGEPTSPRRPSPRFTTRSRR